MTDFSICVTLDGVDDDPDDVIAADSENDALGQAVLAHLARASAAGRTVAAVTATCFAQSPPPVGS